MTDRLAFSETKLANGITIHHKEYDAPFTSLEVVIPVGSSHNTGDIKDGSFHFLEHMVLERSAKFPERGDLKKAIGLKGGHIGASTGKDQTTYSLSIPERYLHEMLEPFLNAIFNPLFHEDDIALHRGIIHTEKLRKARWFPGSNEVSSYVLSQFLFRQDLTLDQRLGTDEDLAAITPDYLKKIHAFYFTPQIRVFMAGPHTADILTPHLEKLTLNAPTPKAESEPWRWVNKDYHTKGFRDLSRHELVYTGYSGKKPDIQTYRAVNFILGYLTNYIHGPIYQWLREEKGWAYELGHYINLSATNFSWTLILPLSEPEHIEEVRRELWKKVETALKDETAINQEVDRIFGNKAYWYQTLGGILESTSETWEEWGRIVTEAEWEALIEKCRDTTFLQSVYKEWMHPDIIGSFCATPLEETAESAPNA